MIAVLETKKNRFDSFDDFKEFIRHKFLKESAIDPELFDACVEFHQDIEVSAGMDAYAPIHEALGWDFKRFTHTANENLYAAFLKNYDGTIWQAVVSVWDEDKQRPYKYFAPKNSGDRAFLPPIPRSIWEKIAKRYGWDVVPEDGEFWEWYKDMDIPLIVTEGGKKALSAFSHGYVAIALFGCECGSKEGELIDDLEPFTSPESTVLIAFDKDDKRSAQLAVARGKKRLTEALRNANCYTTDVKWDSNLGKGLDDVFANQGEEAFTVAYGSAIAKIEKFKRTENGQEPKSKKKKAFEIIKARWGDKLRYNSMLLQCELDGQPIQLDSIALDIAIEFDIDLGNDTASQIILKLSRENEYHPVRDYLEKVASEYPADDLLLDSISSRFLGSDDPLHDTFLKKTLIAAVARQFDPGCQVDTVCVLQGKQGLQKSKFWRALAKEFSWFDDTIASANSSDKDERLKLRRFWFLELAEIESVFRKKEVSSLRGFITTKNDNVRVPYGRSIESFPRTSIFVGSVNPDEFLVDPEGHRRFWVVPVGVDFIDVDSLAEECDRLWAAAVHAYRAGKQWWLTRDEERLNAIANKRWEATDSWEDVISVYLDRFSQISVTEILIDCLKIDLGKHDKQSQMRIVECLKKLGWKKGSRQRCGGDKKVYLWVKPEPENKEVQQVEQVQVNTEVIIQDTIPTLQEVYQSEVAATTPEQQIQKTVEKLKTVTDWIEIGIIPQEILHPAWHIVANESPQREKELRELFDIYNGELKTANLLGVTIEEYRKEYKNG